MESSWWAWKKFKASGLLELGLWTRKAFGSHLTNEIPRSAY
jgi:hypothetical protein